MSSLFLSRLRPDDHRRLSEKLHAIQHGKCFICEGTIELDLNGHHIDHIKPSAHGGPDDETNFALAHAKCNQEKLASNLEVARILSRFAKLKGELAESNRSPNLGDVLSQHVGKSDELHFKIEGNEIKYSIAGGVEIFCLPVFTDPLSGFRSFFAVLPLSVLAHDDRINPRSIGPNIGRLVEEFFLKRPQLHVPLGWIRSQGGRSNVHVFDGQHKAAAQVMLGVKALPVRVFIDPDSDTLITTNTNAGTTLKQVAFDKSVQRSLGSSQYQDRIHRYLRDTGRQEDDQSFSERDLVNHFKGQSREIKRYVLDSVRHGVMSDPSNGLREFIDFGGRGKESPLSYSTVEKTFFSFFIHQEILETPLNFRLEEGENPRVVEREQILGLMNLLTEEIYKEKFDLELGTDKIESKIQKGDRSIPHDHLRAYRMSKEEIIYNWLSYVGQVARNYFINLGEPDPGSRLFQKPFPTQVWINIRKFVQRLAGMPVWVNWELSETVFGGKQNNSFWRSVFETGRTPQGVEVLAKPINLNEMIQ